jgi:hypothetical protein
LETSGIFDIARDEVTVKPMVERLACLFSLAGGITGGWAAMAMAVIDQAIQAAKTFADLSKEQFVAILQKTRSAAANGLFEPCTATRGLSETRAYLEAVEGENISAVAANPDRARAQRFRGLRAERTVTFARHSAIARNSRA